MAYFLGSDVQVCITTEVSNHSIKITESSGDYSAAGEGAATPTGGYGINARAAANAVFADDALVDITGVDIGIGAMDEDIDYLGHNTPLKAEIRKNTTVTLTFKRKDVTFDVLYSGDHDGNIARWGTTSGTALNTGLEEPTTTYGYRLFIQLKASNEIFTIKNCQMTASNITLSPDGTQEQSIEFTSMVEPKLNTAVDVTDTGTGAI